MPAPWSYQNADYLLNGTWLPQESHLFELIIMGLDIDSLGLLDLSGFDLSAGASTAMSVVSGIASIQMASILKLSVESVELPSITHTVEKLQKRGNMKKGIVTDYSVSDMSVSLREDVFQNISRVLENWKFAAINTKTGRLGSPKKYKKTGCLAVFAPDGTKVKFFILKGLIPTSNSLSRWSYNDGGYSTIDLNLSCDNVYAASAEEIIIEGFSISMFT